MNTPLQSAVLQPADRLHALDAVRAGALLLGVVLHAAAAFLEDFPVPLWADAQTSPVAAGIYYVIHMFRMTAFFLIAGFFARLLVERRGVRAFVRDRAKRVAVPLFLFGPVVLLLTGAGLVLGALPHGRDFLQSVMTQLQPPEPAAGAGAAGGGVSLSHLWFLYYLLIFYVLAVLLRTAVRAIDPQRRLPRHFDRVVQAALSAAFGPFLIALPIVLWLLQPGVWNEWVGLPAPFFLTPDPTALIGYGLPFGLGWLLHRQVGLLLGLKAHWALHLTLALALTAWCLATLGLRPQWEGQLLAGTERVLYTVAYVAGLWSWVFALVGLALRFLAAPNPVLRYLADASYWIYLMHLATILFFLTLLRPFDWHWSIKLLIMTTGSLPLLLLSYHYLVRFTWIGATLNGRRHHRGVDAGGESEAAAADDPAAAT